ncbi:MAG: hypothetical protein HYT07_00450 [Candidatus Levybacteria bacterium]|nr:hypothetical protein [Candidatus Levybacteria bacterium]
MKTINTSFNFPTLKAIPYRTFYGMPEKFEDVQMFYSYYFNLKPINVEDFVNSFLSYPKKYEKLGKEGIRNAISDLRKIESLFKDKWKTLDDEEKIAFGFALTHAYFSTDRENFIYESIIDCPPPGFNLESSVLQEKLKTLEKVKYNCAKEYEGIDLYEILNEIMTEMKKVVWLNKHIVKRSYQKEIKRIFGFKDFTELMHNSVLQLLYKHPGIFRFKQPIPNIFTVNIKYTDTPKNYFTFPARKRKSQELKGLGVSPGKTKGKVKICPWVKDAIKKIRKGDILVCAHTDPSWTVILGKVSGVITESGGILSHAAIVSRELKIPCIVGINNALKVLKDDDFIEMNGKSGEIKRLKE